MKTFKKGLTLGLLTLFLISAINGCEQTENIDRTELSTETETDKITEEKMVKISVAAASGINLPDYISCEDGSTLEILKYPNGILGSDSDMIRGCQAGTISVYIGSMAASIDTVPELALFSIPYLLDDLNAYQDMLDHTWKEWFQPYYQQNDLQLLEWKVNYEGCLVSSVPIHTLEDLQSANIRTMKNRYRENYWLLLGADVFPVSYDETGYYLQTGQINVVTAGLRAMIYSGYMDYFHYLIPIKDIPAYSSVVMNLEEFHSLTPEQQKMLMLYVKKAINYEDTVRQCIEMYDLKVLEPDEELDHALRAGKHQIIDMLNKSLGEKTVTDFLSTIEEKADGK